MTPLEIKLLIHIVVSPEPIPHSHLDVVQQALVDFQGIGAIEKVSDTEYRALPRGRAWLQALEMVPPPKDVFIDEAGRVLGK